MKTPICDFVRDYAERDPVRFHMPGHKGNGPLARLDITEIRGADTLYPARGILRESEENAARLFGSVRTLYSAEGSSLCVRAMLTLALLRWREAGNEGRPLVLAGRNAHKTFLAACALLDMDVEWLYGESLLTCRPTGAEVAARLAVLPQRPAAVYLTSPDYLGSCTDLRHLAELCH